ncbi:MAG: hypothetical protein IKH20_07250, partial [Clostridiales bacterium]|nr:hypothetical protein [Clostridiales bacterium]
KPFWWLKSIERGALQTTPRSATLHSELFAKVYKLYEGLNLHKTLDLTFASCEGVFRTFFQGEKVRYEVFVHSRIDFVLIVRKVMYFQIKNDWIIPAVSFWWR